MKETVYIIFGGENTVRDNGMDSIHKFEFDTLAEMEAFMLGVDASVGWITYQNCDTKEEAEAYVTNIMNEEKEEDENDGQVKHR